MNDDTFLSTVFSLGLTASAALRKIHKKEIKLLFIVCVKFKHICQKQKKTWYLTLKVFVVHSPILVWSGDTTGGKESLCIFLEIL